MESNVPVIFVGSSRLHDTMFRKVMRCPVSFFDVTPPGRILQRFSRDMDECEFKYYVVIFSIVIFF